MTTVFKQRPGLDFVLPVFVFIGSFIITQTGVFQQHQNNLSPYLAMDLLISAPLLSYLVSRRTSSSKLAALRVFMIGAFLTGVFLPKHLPQPLAAIKTAASFLAEGTLLVALFWRFYKARKQNKSQDFLFQSRKILQQVIGHKKAAHLLASELAVFYYAFAGLEKNSGKAKQFSVYKQNGVRLVLSTFLCLFLVETAGTHLLIGLWNKTVAWVLTALGLYTCLQLFAHIRSLRTRPALLTDTHLILRNGLLGGDALVPLQEIENLERIAKPLVGKTFLKLAFIASLEKPNIVVYMKGEVAIEKPFGITQRGRIILLSVDQPEEFLSLVKSGLRT